jgi:hypothetical protein
MINLTGLYTKVGPYIHLSLKINIGGLTCDRERTLNEKEQNKLL